jgi:hypothetical protein
VRPVLAYQHGYTQEQIGKLLGVNQRTVGRDLDNSNLGNKPKLNHAKTTTNPSAIPSKALGLDLLPGRSDTVGSIPVHANGFSNGQPSIQEGDSIQIRAPGFSPPVVADDLDGCVAGFGAGRRTEREAHRRALTRDLRLTM